MKGRLGFVVVLLLVAAGRAEVRVFVQDSNGVALVKYECTSGEVVRAFALSVSADQGQIVGISDFLCGPSAAGATGYGVFPCFFSRSYCSGRWNQH
jgi:hypothetical protein